MPIDPNIPLGVRPVQVESPMNALAQAQQFGLNNLKMQEAEQIMSERNALRGLDINAPDYIAQVGRVNPKLALELQQGQTKNKAAQVDLEAKLMTNARNTLAPINDQGTYDLWRQQVSSQLPGLTQFLPAKFDDKVKTSLMLEADKYIAQTKLSLAQQQDLGIKAGHLNIAKQDLANKYDPTIQSNLAAVKAGGEATGKAVATARINLPTVIANAEDAINVIDQMIGKPAVYKDGKLVQAGTKPHAGFQDYVGATLKPGARFIEGTNAAGYETFQKQLEGKAFTEAFDTLRGGGSITEKEGEKATAAKLRMSKAQSEKEYMEAAREYQGIVRKGVERAKAKAAGGGAAPAGGEIDFNSLK